MAFAQRNGFSLRTWLLFLAIVLATTTTALAVACLGYFFFQWQDATIKGFFFWSMGLLAVSVVFGILFALILGRIMDLKRDRQGAPLPETDGTRVSSFVPAGRREIEASGRDKASSHPSRPVEGLADFCLPKGASLDKFVRNHVTVLSAGVRGFKSLADDRNTSEAIRSLNAYFDIADDIIREHGGVIDKFIGDALIAIFGGSPMNPDHVERAVRCALALQRGLHEAGKDGNPIMRKVGIGISSGVVISAHMGPRSREECAFLGESFKLAYSLNVMAGPGEILISKDVYRKIQGKVSVRPVPPREMMDRTEPWEIFRFQSFADDEGRN